jgi:hypothetical protein
MRKEFEAFLTLVKDEKGEKPRTAVLIKAVWEIFREEHSPTNLAGMVEEELACLPTEDLHLLHATLLRIEGETKTTGDWMIVTSVDSWVVEALLMGPPPQK